MSKPRQVPRIGLVIALASLVGCSTIPDQQPTIPEQLPCQCPPPPESVMTCQMDDMMQYYESLRKLTSPELGKLYERVKQNFAQNKSDANRIRLVLLLTLPQTSFRDIPAAVNLLNESPRDIKSNNSSNANNANNSNNANNLQSFRNLLAALLADHQRLSNNAEEVSQKLKEEQKRADMLQHQINALKSMEKNLILIQP